MTDITIISDTHMRHREIDLPGGDLLLHCGDMFNLKTPDTEALADMDDWFGSLSYRKVICTAGNHDHPIAVALASANDPFQNASLLIDQGIEFDGLRIYGSPWVPGLPTHAFSRDTDDLQAAWSAVPDGLDILLTHIPPRDLLDRSSRGVSYGCELLAERLKRATPSLHAFGHVHASAGSLRHDNRISVNASMEKSGSPLLRSPVRIRSRRVSVGLVFDIL